MFSCNPDYVICKYRFHIVEIARIFISPEMYKECVMNESIKPVMKSRLYFAGFWFFSFISE